MEKPQKPICCTSKCEEPVDFPEQMCSCEYEMLKYENDLLEWNKKQQNDTQILGTDSQT